MTPIGRAAVNAARVLGVPEAHLSAVAQRAEDARIAVARFDGYSPQGRGLDALARRVVLRAERDHEAGVLERLV